MDIDIDIDEDIGIIGIQEDSYLIKNLYSLNEQYSKLIYKLNKKGEIDGVLNLMYASRDRVVRRDKDRRGY